MKNIRVEDLKDENLDRITDIYNYYVKNSMAVYRNDIVTRDFFSTSPLDNSVKVLFYENKIIGFGLLRPYNLVPAFDRVAYVGYFIDKDFTGRGFGKVILDSLINEALNQNRNNILAHISSHNEASLKFHKKHGFNECGRFIDIGLKNGESFDVIYMQKIF